MHFLTSLHYNLGRREIYQLIHLSRYRNYLESHPNLTILKQDVQDVDAIPLKGVEAVINLANIANDPGVELNPELSWDVNVLATQKLLENSIKNKVKHFIFASSGSVYGIKKENERKAMKYIIYNIES